MRKTERERDKENRNNGEHEGRREEDWRGDRGEGGTDEGREGRREGRGRTGEGGTEEREGREEEKKEEGRKDEKEGGRGWRGTTPAARFRVKSLGHIPATPSPLSRGTD